MDALAIVEGTFRGFAHTINRLPSPRLRDVFSNVLGILKPPACPGWSCTAPLGGGPCPPEACTDIPCTTFACEPVYGFCYDQFDNCWTNELGYQCCDCWCPTEGYCYCMT